MSGAESNLVAHARRELTIIGEEPETINGYLKVIQAFADMGHSGGSASVAIPTIERLLRFENLAPLTDDPDEWICHSEEAWGRPGGVWQSKRNSEAFSNDGGKTYYLLSEIKRGVNSGDRGKPILHNSESSKPNADVQNFRNHIVGAAIADAFNNVGQSFKRMNDG